MANKKSFWENFIVLMIVLAIVQIFLEDFSRLGEWKIDVRKGLIILGFLFDLIFSIEFIIRSIASRKSNGWAHYFKKDKGWVDLFSSVPLLLFNSGPIMIGMFFPGVLIALPFLGVLNILKITKILRIARVLRILRVLKIFKMSSIQAEKTTMQVNRVISISIVSITLVLIIFPMFSGVFYNMDTSVRLKTQKYVSILQDGYNSLRKRDLERMRYINAMLVEDKDVIFLYQMGREVVNHIGEDMIPSKHLPKMYFYTDYKILKYLNYKLYYSIRDIIEENARVNLLIEALIVMLILSLLVFYSDPIVK